ncbi:hypothetical protein CgunFtcFv8_025081 [Champsocephalus gunnari]|uniref:Uncharacterized protein n=1 Tax=Champsocephalus gunnari TaxID=52237 RepID=A0AAN8DDB9_CHAGU|nr:hypothetical protein CgunFtcFv8_025081 [Champsocephalus gunnari]
MASREQGQKDPGHLPEPHVLWSHEDKEGEQATGASRPQLHQRKPPPVAGGERSNLLPAASPFNTPPSLCFEDALPLFLCHLHSLTH